MKSLNGLLFIVAGGLIIWIGATGRLPALAAALGMIRQAPGEGGTAQPSQAGINQPQNFGDVKAGSSSTSAPTATQGINDLGNNFYRNLMGMGF